MSEYRTTPADTEGMPPGIPYIIGNEAAERFSYYGMRTILTIFMVRYLFLMGDTAMPAMSRAEAQEHYHTFSSWVYFFPVLGAIVADAFTGKYRIIMGVSVLYCLGHLALALMGGGGLSAERWLWVGLFLIALGSGGIKPCVSAHVGDQFGTRNQHLMEKVYQWFYFAINFGSTRSTLLTPWLLEWYGPHVAFGVPGVLMAIATVMFWLGRNQYIHVPPGGTAFLREVFSRDGIATILRLSLVYLCIAVFWALFDQTSSAWVLQAEDMNLRWLGIDWLPSQIQVLNPILVMAMIPLFQFLVYPAIDRVFRLSPLRKIGIGLFVMAAGFGLSAVVQGWIDTGARPSVAWQFLAYVVVTAAEIMVSITGLEFSYSQAPKTMKSVIMAVWLLSVSLGNYVTAVVNHWIQVPGLGGVVAQVAELEPTPAGSGATVAGWKLRVADPTPRGDSAGGRGRRVRNDRRCPAVIQPVCQPVDHDDARGRGARCRQAADRRGLLRFGRRRRGQGDPVRRDGRDARCRHRRFFRPAAPLPPHDPRSLPARRRRPRRRSLHPRRRRALGHGCAC
jgi:POT family proton-dependent oligopeptide transporter